MQFTEQLKLALSHPVAVKAFDELPSTNTYLKSWAREGAPHGALVVANSQSAGRGRFVRSFFSPPGGLYLSLFVKGQGLLPGQLTTLAAVSVVEAVGALSGQVLHIKWVNDLLLDCKKAGGILSEGMLIDNQLAGAVIGIGLNTHHEPFSEELQANSAHISGFEEITTRAQLAAAIVNKILSGLKLMPAHMAVYRERCVTLGQQVSFEHGGVARTGQAMDVDDEGALLVVTREGPLRLLSGDVSLLKT